MTHGEVTYPRPGDSGAFVGTAQEVPVHWGGSSSRCCGPGCRVPLFPRVGHVIAQHIDGVGMSRLDYPKFAVFLPEMAAGPISN